MQYLLSDLRLTTTTGKGFRKNKENLAAIAHVYPNIHWGENLTPDEVLKEWNILNGFYIVYIEESLLAFQNPPIKLGKDDRVWIATNGDRYKAFITTGQYGSETMLVKVPQYNTPTRKYEV